ncbi:hypothetical protein BD309DRAFT_969635, partial [Dichomitus squalens]
MACESRKSSIYGELPVSLTLSTCEAQRRHHASVHFLHLGAAIIYYYLGHPSSQNPGRFRGCHAGKLRYS